MALREKLRDRVQALLEPGEQIQEVFLAQSGPNPNLVLLTYLVYFFNKYYVVAATDRSIVLMRAPMMTPAKPKAVASRLPRATKIGPVSGALWAKTALPDGPIWVHRRFYKDVAQADADETSGGAAETSPEPREADTAGDS